MDENNNQGLQVPKEPTKKEKAEQAGKDVAEVGAKAAANYFAGPVGGAIVDKVAQTKLGQDILNQTGKTLARNPMTRNTLAKAQPAIQKAKPMLNAAANSVGGNAAGGANELSDMANGANNLSNGAGNPSGTSPSDPLTSGNSNNSGFGNDKSGLFSPFSKSNNSKNENASGDLFKDFKKSKKVIGIIAASMPIVLPVFVCIIVAVVVMGQIMVVAENISGIKNKIDTGIEKLINFAQGEGWMTNDESFFYVLNKEYENFPETGGDKLDVPLIAATIHYSTTVDFEQFEQNEGSSQENSANTEPIIGALNKDRTASFYNVAKDKLGSPNATVWGEKRLLGYAVKTDISFKWYTWGERELAAAEWKELFRLYEQTIKARMGDQYWNDIISLLDPFTSTIAFNKIYNEMKAYLAENGSILAGLDYDLRNKYYEVQEFVYILGHLFESTKNTQEYEEEPAEKAGLAWILAPDVKRTMNYGYDEYNQLRDDLISMKAILSENGIRFDTDSEVLDYAKNSSNTELKELYDDYTTNEDKYLFSYTHYLQEVYIPFTYFYGKEYTQVQVEKIIDEIYDQRDFYYYLIGEKTQNYECSGSCEYNVFGKQVSNLKVRLLQCSEGELGKPIPGEELVDFEKYILGVVYAEIGDGAPVEAAKAQAIAARSFALTRPKEMGNATGLKLEQENGNWILSIKNCTADQVYCDPDKGCSNTTDPSESGNSTTVYSGMDTKPYIYKGPLDETSQIRSAVSAVFGKVLLDENDDIVPTGYTHVQHNRWISQANSGMDYTEILLSEYSSGKKISKSSCSNVCNKATGDFTQWKQGGSPWSDITLTDNNVCDGPCTIGKIGCTATALSIQVARSGVPITIPELNPGTFVLELKAKGQFSSGGGINSWHAPSVVAPTFVYQNQYFLNGQTKMHKTLQIQKLINEGHYLIMEVKSGCNKGQHWVAVDYVDGDNVYMMDPASTDTLVWDRYEPECISRVVSYKVVE